MAYMHRISARASFSPGKRVLHVRNIDNAKVNIGLQGMLELNTCQRDLCVWANSVLLKKNKKRKKHLSWKYPDFQDTEFCNLLHLVIIIPSYANIHVVI